MRGYELTERGKIVIVVIIAAILLLSAVIVKGAFAGSPAGPDASGPGNVEPNGTPSDPNVPPAVGLLPPPTSGGITENPSPLTGSETAEGPVLPGGSEPGESPTPDSAEPDDPQTSGEAAEAAQSEGSLSFRFSPTLQTSLDAETASMIGDFLRAPDYSPDCLIVVSMPSLSNEDAERLMSAVVNVLAPHGIYENRLRREIQSAASAGETFDVSLRFVPVPFYGK